MGNKERKPQFENIVAFHAACKVKYISKGVPPLFFESPEISIPIKIKMLRSTTHTGQFIDNWSNIVYFAIQDSQRGEATSQLQILINQMNARRS